jgi:FkbM family methyltransferase
MWCGGYFEATELEFLLDVLKPGMIFVDVGANVGFYSIPAAKKVEHGTVFAFEPCAWTYRTLLENVKINKLTNIQAVNSALADRKGQATLQVNVRGKDGLNTLGRPTHVDCEVVATERVQVTSLDDFMLEQSISSVDAMKIDVEGAELFVLKGATNLLRQPNAPLILYESHSLSKGFNYHPVEQMWFLEKLGYSLYVIDPVCRKISRPPHGRAYDAMIIASKSSHPFYPGLLERLV